jgi:hypothetical protein
MQSRLGILKNILIFATEITTECCHEKQKYPDAPHMPEDWLVSLPVAHTCTYCQTDSIWY